MKEYTFSKFVENCKLKGRTNYLAEYHPESFWGDAGPLFYNMFDVERKQIKDKLNIEINLSELVARVYNIKPKSVLEVGCGFGRCMPYINDNVKSIEKYIGIELSSSMIEMSKKYLMNYSGKDDFKIIQGNASKLPFNDNEFELTYTHVVLTHIPPEIIPKVVDEICRVTKNWIVHIERFRFPYEHPTQHRWSHMLAPMYMERGFEMWDNSVINDKDYTNALVMKRGD